MALREAPAGEAQEPKLTMRVLLVYPQWVCSRTPELF